MTLNKIGFVFGEIRYGPVYIGSVVPLKVTVVVADYNVMMNLREKATLALPPGTRYEIRKRNERSLVQPIVMRWVREKKMDDEKKWVDSNPNNRHPVFSLEDDWCLLARFTTPEDSSKSHLRIVK